MLGLLIPLALIVLAIECCALAFLKLQAKETRQPTAVAPIPVNVITEDVKITPELPDVLLLPALVEVNRAVQVSAEVAGRVVEIPCTEGCPCRKGDLLVALNTDLLQAEYDRAKAQADFDTTQYERMTYLEPQGAATTEQADEARSRMEVSKADVTLAKARLDRAVIVAPISGVLNRVLVEEGEYVTPGTAVADIVEMDTVKVVAMVPEPDVHYFHKGDETQVLFDNHGTEESVTGAIIYMSEVADVGTRSTRVEIEVANGDRRLRSGQIVRVLMTRRVLKDVIMVPLLAIIPLEQGYRVYVAEKPSTGNKTTHVAAVRNVTTSRIIKKDAEGIDRVQVLTGLQPGEHLIVNGHRLVTNGQRVNVAAGNGRSLKELLTEAKLGR